MAQKVKELEEHNRVLHEQFEKRIAELEKLIQKLQARLAVYENANVPSSQRRFPDKREKETTGKPGRPPGFEGSTRVQPKPDKVEVVLAKQCNHCGTRLGKPLDFISRVVEEIPEPQPVIVTEFKLARYLCKHCKEQVTASHPDCPDEGVFGPRTITQVSLLKYEGRLPCQLVCTALQRDYGLQVTPATVLAINSRVANSLQPEYELILRRIRNAKVLYVDETSFHVGGVKYWLWIFVSDNETLVVIRHSRGKKVLREVLGKHFQGFIVCDGHRSYSNFTTNIQRCWAHLLREAEYAAERVGEAKELYKTLRELYWKLVKTLESNPSMAERLRLKNSALKTIRSLLGKQWKKERTLKVVGYLRNGLKHWFTFVLNQGMEATNNRAERALREHVVIRKIIGTLRSSKGVRCHEVIMSVFATWRKQAPNVNIREKLVQTLTKS